MNIVLLKDTAEVQDDSLILKAVTSNILEKDSLRKDGDMSMFIQLNSQHTTPAITSMMCKRIRYAGWRDVKRGRSASWSYLTA